MSLYLKYRPQAFFDVVGQNHIIDILLAQAKKKKFSHNYLLYGPRGTGKTTTARLLAKMVNCSTFTADGLPDLENDPAVKLIDDGKVLDFVEIDAASHTGVDNIREEIIDKALYQPTHLKKKVYIIDEVHMLSKGAFNALLKIMEEPPEYLFFILATTEINKVPDTISSRCQIFNFKRLSIENIVKRLKYIADKENILYETEGLRLIAKLSTGAMRDGIKYLEQVSMLGKITEANVSQFLGVVEERVLKEFLDILETGTFEILNVYLDQLVENGTDITNFTKDLLLRLDEHFMENPITYGRLALLLKGIYKDIKNYPYPVLLYKSQFYLFFHDSFKKTAIQKTVLPGKNKEEAFDKPLIVKGASEDKTVKLPVENNSHKTKDSISGGFTHQELLEQMIEQVDKVIIKSVLQKSSIIQSFVSGVLTIIVINQAFYGSMQKPETITYLEGIVKSITQQDVSIKRIYMSKDDYLKEALG